MTNEVFVVWSDPKDFPARKMRFVHEPKVDDWFIVSREDAGRLVSVVTAVIHVPKDVNSDEEPYLQVQAKEVKWSWKSFFGELLTSLPKK